MAEAMKTSKGSDAEMVKATENTASMANDSEENDVLMVDAEEDANLKRDTEKRVFQKFMLTKLDELVCLLPQRERQGPPPSDSTKVSPPIKLLLYFDEAQSLVNVAVGKSQSTNYHILLRCINSWCTKHPEVVVAFLSTNGKLRDLARPSKLVASWSYPLQPPIVETPFDCSPHFPLRPGLTLSEVSSLRHIAQFGRPL